MGLVYRAVNTVNGMMYIGSTKTTLSVRRKQHENASRYDPRSPFHRALAKYGITVFRWDTLYRSNSVPDLLTKEKAYIAALGANTEFGYNVPTYDRVCEECGKSYTTEQITSKFCSSVCRGRSAYKRRIDAAQGEGRVKTKQCPSCGTIFTTTRDTRRYCYNKACYREAKAKREQERRNH